MARISPKTALSWGKVFLMASRNPYESTTTEQRKWLIIPKLFNPCGAATWLFTELDPEDGDTLFGLADLGCGTPELGYSSLAEISFFRNCFGIGIERDLYFAAKHSLSVYTEAARAAGRIVEFGPEIEAAGNRRNAGADPG